MEVDGLCQPCIKPEIIKMGNFLNDQYFESARKTLQELMGQMQNSLNQQFQWPPSKVDYLLAELGAWQQSGQSLGSAMSSLRHNELFTTVFRFEPDNFKMLIDVKGFQPFNLKLNVNDQFIDVIATKEEASSNNPVQVHGQVCVGYMTRNIRRRYTLPQKLAKEHVQCSLSADGIMFISAPWRRC